jgi:uncharacterized membrane protein YdjX (TVP38/TMEM64 family)
MQGNIYRQALIIIAAMAVPIVPFVAIGELPGEQWLSNADDNALAFALTGGGLLALDILLPVPSSIVGSLLGSRLGWGAGFLSAWSGLCIGNLVGFLLARLAVTRLDRKMPGFSEQNTLIVVFLTRPVPIVAEAMVITAGIARMPLAHFVAVSAAGNAIYAAVLSANGAMLVPDAMLGPWLIVPMLLPVFGWLVWHVFAARHDKRGETAGP